MGRRYYCDFCNRGFADTPFSRRKHINSNHHQRLRKLHYDSFKDPATLLAEEAQKQPCKRFFQYGHCDFGDHCRFSHVDYNKLKSQQAEAALALQMKSKEPCVKEWVRSWKNKNKSKQIKTKEKDEAEVFTLPVGFPPIQQLPPSLLPPPPGGYPSLPKCDWG